MERNEEEDVVEVAAHAEQFVQDRFDEFFLLRFFSFLYRQVSKRTKRSSPWLACSEDKKNDPADIVIAKDFMYKRTCCTNLWQDACI